MFIKTYFSNPETRKLDQIIEKLKAGDLVVFPTDSVFSFACLLSSQKSIDTLYTLKKVKPKDAQFSILCRDISQVSAYTKPIENHVFKLMKKVLPGPFTFILPASNLAPKAFKINKKKQIGIRIVDAPLVTYLLEHFSQPLVCTSVSIESQEQIETFYAAHKHLIGAFVDVHETLQLEPSTIINCLESLPVVQRLGKGKIDL